MPRWPALSEQPPEPGIFAELTITIKSQDAGGMMGSLSVDGMFADPTLERRFYFFNEVPPPDLPPQMFWAIVLGKIADFLADDLPVSFG